MSALHTGLLIAFLATNGLWLLGISARGLWRLRREARRIAQDQPTTTHDPIDIAYRRLCEGADQ